MIRPRPHGALRRSPAALAVAAAVAGVLAVAAGASGAPAPKKDDPPAKPKVTISSPNAGIIVLPPGGEEEDEDATDSLLQSLPRTYQALVRRFGTMSPADSMGDGAYQWAEAAFKAGKFDEASKAYGDFARRYPRNLKVNDALSLTLLIKEARDFEDQPLLLFARGRAYRDGGKVDSAITMLTAAAQRFPGAKVRHHVHLMLAEMARDRGDHASALRWAVAGADSVGRNRIAPFALRIAAESSMDLGEPPQKALAYYKEILERYPRSPIAPEARARSLEIRKKMPQ
ncbi:MAG TPA: tetratricopeptide repeat protein [Candidatus Eisenbacteria bacterium]|nr:tetratricopeptide repeat protein [Candidatus Eisenbacteria bacterium]